MPPGRPPKPIDPAHTRGWCDHCKDLTVRGDTQRCEVCGGGLARGFECVEAADEVLYAAGVMPFGLNVRERRLLVSGQQALDF